MNAELEASLGLTLDRMCMVVCAHCSLEGAAVSNIPVLKSPISTGDLVLSAPVRATELRINGNVALVSAERIAVRFHVIVIHHKELQCHIHRVLNIAQTCCMLF